MLTIEKVTSREGLHGLEPVWNTLLSKSASNNITLTWEWLTTWWDVFGDERELYILLVRDGQEIVGIAPLLKRTIQHYGLLPFRRLEFLASGEDEADEICSDYLDFILQMGRETEALETIAHYLHERSAEWDELILTDVLGDSPNLPILNKLTESHGMHWQVINEQTATYLPLPDDWEAFSGRLSRSFQKNIQRDRRVAAANGGDFQVIESEEDFAANFQILIDLHQSRWTSREEPGVFASEKFTIFHRSLSLKFLPHGWVKLFMLHFGGEPVAALYVFTYNNKAYYYQGGFSQEKSKLYSPGSLNLSYSIEKAIELRLAEWDFLKGDSDGYQSRWGAQVRNVVQIRLAQSHSKEFIYATTTKCIDGLRRVKRSLKR